MPTVFTHAFVASAAAASHGTKVSGLKLWPALVVCSILPDADVIGLVLGVPYEAVFGHRGLFHSLTFALLLSVVVVLIGFHHVPRLSRAWWTLTVLFFLVTASHGVLDAFTNGGLGIAFFSPFDTTRYFVPWRPIQVSPIGGGFFSSDLGRQAVWSELKFVWLPVGVVWLGVWLARKRLRKASDLTKGR
jgi:inner membrane protein